MKVEKSDIEALIDSTLREEFRHFDLNTYGKRVDPQKNTEMPVYLMSHRHEYIRTIFDVTRFAENHGTKRVLEIGAKTRFPCCCGRHP